jgi:hypothetical protein
MVCELSTNTITKVGIAHPSCKVATCRVANQIKTAVVISQIIHGTNQGVLLMKLFEVVE